MCRTLIRTVDRYTEGLGDMEGWADVFRRAGVASPVQAARAAVGRVAPLGRIPGVRGAMAALNRLPAPIPSVKETFGRKGSPVFMRKDYSRFFGAAPPPPPPSMMDVRGAMGRLRGRSTEGRGGLLSSALSRAVASRSALGDMEGGIIDYGMGIVDTVKSKLDDLDKALKLIIALSGVAALTGVVSVVRR